MVVVGISYIANNFSKNTKYNFQEICTGKTIFLQLKLVILLTKLPLLTKVVTIMYTIVIALPAIQPRKKNEKMIA